ncbi:hypothetical protein PGB28_14045 [Primorskyibacter aestuariivivens]|uniref:hypothetical protein n=1 Tax=Primorskyibacter aestuariivivens TaxID=1888912 RepID=UPI0023019206|nr:hypothetical protein [Primorskyibacter aestuariivivens]MDA7429587.1 hypothetical protein [Primorskyibacter aestuariivivens]
MSAPFVIWTLRRTGGTTLATLLERLTEHPCVSHEPFNLNRTFGRVTSDWLKRRDREQLRAGVEQALAERPVIKHCFETKPPGLNAALMQVATEKGYRHIILDRRAETDRILSLALAELTGAWGSNTAEQIYHGIAAGERTVEPMDIEAVVAHLHKCRQSRQDIRKMLERVGQDPFVIYFEDIFSDPEAGRAKVGALVSFLGIDLSLHPDYDAQLTDALMHRGQNSARILSAVPNIVAAREALENAGQGLVEIFTAS